MAGARKRNAGLLAAWHLAGVVAAMPLTGTALDPEEINPFGSGVPRASRAACPAEFIEGGASCEDSPSLELDTDYVLDGPSAGFDLFSIDVTPGTMYRFTITGAPVNFFARDYFNCASLCTGTGPVGCYWWSGNIDGGFGTCVDHVATNVKMIFSFGFFGGPITFRIEEGTCP